MGLKKQENIIMMADENHKVERKGTQEETYGWWLLCVGSFFCFELFSFFAYASWRIQNHLQKNSSFLIVFQYRFPAVRRLASLTIKIKLLILYWRMRVMVYTVPLKITSQSIFFFAVVIRLADYCRLMWLITSWIISVYVIFLVYLIT